MYSHGCFLMSSILFAPADICVTNRQPRPHNGHVAILWPIEPSQVGCKDSLREILKQVEPLSRSAHWRTQLLHLHSQDKRGRDWVLVRDETWIPTNNAQAISMQS